MINDCGEAMQFKFCAALPTRHNFEFEVFFSVGKLQNKCISISTDFYSAWILLDFVTHKFLE